MKKLFKKTRQFLCSHKYKTLWKGQFGNLLCDKRYFEEDKKVIMCIKCKKLKL